MLDSWRLSCEWLPRIDIYAGSKDMLTRALKLPFIAPFLFVWAITASISENHPDSGTIRENVYKNDFFGFSYTCPKGWSLLQQQSQTGIRLAPGAALYTLLFATASPSNGTMSRSNAGIVVLAEDVSHTGIRDPKSAAAKLADVLTHTQPPHKLVNSGSEVNLNGIRFFRIDYEQQTFSDVRHYFCTVITVRKGYALRFSFIADSKERLDEICDTTKSIGFGIHE